MKQHDVHLEATPPSLNCTVTRRGTSPENHMSESLGKFLAILQWLVSLPQRGPIDLRTSPYSKMIRPSSGGLVRVRVSTQIYGTESPYSLNIHETIIVKQITIAISGYRAYLYPMPIIH